MPGQHGGHHYKHDICEWVLSPWTLFPKGAFRDSGRGIFLGTPIVILVLSCKSSADEHGQYAFLRSEGQLTFGVVLVFPIVGL